MLKAVGQNADKKRSAEEGHLPSQNQPSKRPAQEEAEVALRPLPVKLSDQDQKEVNAKVAEYKNTKKFKVDVIVQGVNRTRLMQAAFVGDYIDFIALIILGADLNKKSSPNSITVNAKPDTNWTPLMMASYRGHLEMVYLLLMFRVDVNHQSDFGYTAFTLARGVECAEIQQLLLEQGAEHDLPGKPYVPRGYLALALKLNGEENLVAPSLAEEMTEEEEKNAVAAKIEEYKKEKNFDVDKRIGSGNKPRLMQAIFYRDIIDFLALLQMGASVNRISTYGAGSRRDTHWSPAMMASHKGRLRMLKELVVRRVDLNIRSGSGYSALMLAAEGNYPEVVKFLLRHGADHRLKTNEGFNVLEMVQGYPESHQDIKTILKKHVDNQQKLENVKSSDLIRLIASAPDMDEEEALNQMVIHEDSLNQANDLGCTPLHTAVGLGSISFTKALLRQGVYLDTSAFSGWLTPLHIAAIQKKEEIARLLIAAGADPCIKDLESKTAKDYAVMGTSLYTLLEHAERGKIGTVEGLHFSMQSNRSVTSLPDFTQEPFEEGSIQPLESRLDGQYNLRS